MRSPLPFDKKNAEDFFKISRAIQEALETIRQDRTLKISQSTLSQLSGIHRTTLRNRSWPIEELEKIKQSRESKEVGKNETKFTQEKKLLANTIEELENRLKMSRDEVAKWFHKSLAYETELESVKGVNKLLKQKLDDQQKTIDELRRKSERSNVATFRKRERDETISELT